MHRLQKNVKNIDVELNPT